MTHNKIEVLFFSGSFVLFEAVNILFADEDDFSCTGTVTLSELCDLWQSNLDAVIIIDLSDCMLDFDLIAKRYRTALASRSFVFLFDSDYQVDSVSKHNFSSYEVVLKPFRINDLFAKVRDLSANVKQLEHSLFFFKGNYFDSRKNQLRNSDGKMVRLTEKETKIITILCEEEGRVMPKELLLKSVWGYNETISTHTLETHIYRLRKKIELGLGETELILKNNAGYFLNLPKSGISAKEN